MGRLIGAATAGLALVLALTACTGGTGSSDSPGSTQNGGSGSSSAVPAGLYGLGSSRVADPVITPTGALNFYLVALSRSGHSAILRMSGSETTCHGILSTSHEEKMTLSGDEEVEGTAEFVAYGCQYQDLEHTTIGLTALYDLDELHLSVSASFEAASGEVDPESIEVAVQHGTEPMLAMMARLIGASLSGDDVDESEMGDWASYYPGDDGDGEVALSSQDPLTGTITLSGLVNEDTGAQLSLTTGFRCMP
jgi:hypothetical protein